jgi:tetratricopeptide (TPR) repeat protein
VTPVEAGGPQPAAEAVAAADATGAPPPEEAFPQVSLIEERPPSEPEAAPGAPLDTEARERKKEIWEVLNSLPSKNHFEVLGVEPGCSDEDVKRAYAAVVKRFHPDALGDPRLEDMHDFLAAILIRAREALEVLGTRQSRAQYEAKSGILRRPREPGRVAGKPHRASRPCRAAAPTACRLLLPGANSSSPGHPLALYPTIQMLENAVRRWAPCNQHKGGSLAGYTKNPKWIRKAEEYLQEVVREDPGSFEAHYELGLLYKQVGQVARAQAAFRRVVELKPDHREAAAELGLDAGPAPGGGLLKRLFGRGKAS